MATIPQFLRPIYISSLYRYDVYPKMLSLWTEFAASLDAFINDETFEEYSNRAKRLRCIGNKDCSTIVDFVEAVKEMKGIVYDETIKQSMLEKYEKADKNDPKVQEKVTIVLKVYDAANKFFNFAQKSINGSITYKGSANSFISYTLNFW